MNFNDQLFMIEELNKKISKLEQINLKQNIQIDTLIKQNSTLLDRIESLENNINSLPETFSIKKDDRLKSSTEILANLATLWKGDPSDSSDLSNKEDKVEDTKDQTQIKNLVGAYIRKKRFPELTTLSERRSDIIKIINMALDYLSNHTDSAITIDKINRINFYNNRPNFTIVIKLQGNIKESFNRTESKVIEIEAEEQKFGDFRLISVEMN